jgi:hypothetical protein
MGKALVVLLLFAVPLAAFSLGSGFGVTGSLDLGAGVYNTFIVPAVAFVWQAELFGSGFEVRGYLSPSAGDLYLGGFLLFKLWWIDLGLGLTLPILQPGVVDPRLIPVSDPFDPAIRLGFTAPLFDLGPGKLTIGLNHMVLP